MLSITAGNGLRFYSCGSVVTHQLKGGIAGSKAPN
ncbi:hypothetical protein PsAD5_03492 [Pseudovibrio sp. Ad5]|nr:hypothetical protein PsAD5_03492 [Pseudovibrio sp. Ad5]